MLCKQKMFRKVPELFTLPKRINIFLISGYSKFLLKIHNFLLFALSIFDRIDCNNYGRKQIKIQFFFSKRVAFYKLVENFFLLRKTLKI
jgi:hypothetical protein